MKYIAMARRQNKTAFGLNAMSVMPAYFSVVIRNSKKNLTVNSRNYYCHGDLITYRAHEVKALVESFRPFVNSFYKGNEEIVDWYLDYVLNRHCLSGVAMVRKPKVALRYGVPFDVDSYGEFAIRQYAITLRMLKEFRKNLFIVRHALESGFSEHTAFAAYSLFGTVHNKPNQVYYWGGMDHTFLYTTMDIAEACSFLNTKYEEDKKVIKYSEADRKNNTIPLHSTVSPSNGTSVNTFSSLYRCVISPSAEKYRWGDSNTVFMELDDPRYLEYLNTINKHFTG